MVCLLVRFCHALVYECGVVVWFCLVVVACFVRFNKAVFVFANFFKILAEFSLEALGLVVGFKLNVLDHLKHIQSSNSSSSFTCGGEPFELNPYISLVVLPVCGLIKKKALQRIR